MMAASSRVGFVDGPCGELDMLNPDLAVPDREAAAAARRFKASH